MASPTTVLKKVGKIFLYLLLGIFIILALALIYINTDSGKNQVRKQVVSYLEDKLHTNLSIKEIDYSLPKWIEIRGIYIEDQQKDSLLYGEKIRVDLNMFKLLRGDTDIRKLELDNVLVQLKKAATDSVFNFNFIVDAFTGNKLATPNPDTSALKISLKKLSLNQVRFIMDDIPEGNRLTASIDHLESTLKKFQPDRLNFGIETFDAKGLHVIMRSTKPEKRDTLIRTIPDSLKSESTYGLYVSAKHFLLNDVRVDVENEVSGMLYKNDIQTLKLTEGLFSLEQSILSGDSLLLQQGYVQFRSPNADGPEDVIITSPEDTVDQAWYIKAAQLNLIDLAFKYDDQLATTAPGFDPAHIDMQNIQANVSDFLFSADTSRARVKQLAFQEQSGLQLDSTHAIVLFTDQELEASELYIQTPKSLIRDLVKLRYDSLAGISTNPQNSLLELRLQATEIAFDDLYLLVPTLESNFPRAEFAHRKLQLNTELKGNLQRVYIPYLQLKGLDGSSLSASGTVYNLTDADRFSYDLYIKNGQFLKQDLLKFIPAENREQLKDLPNLVSLSGHLKGNSRGLRADLKTGGPGISFAGIIDLKNIQNPASLQYSLDAKSFMVDRNVLLGFLPPGSLPENIRLPAQVQGSGSFKGSASGFESNMRFQTEYGQLAIVGFIQDYANPEQANYDLTLTTQAFHLGRLLQMDSVLGTVSMQVKAEGKGFDYKTMNNHIATHISSLQYKQYNYRDAQLDADFSDGQVESQIRIKDSNLILQSNLSANLNQPYPSFSGYIDLDTIRLNALNLSDDTLNISMYTTLDAPSTTPRALDFRTLIDSIHFQYGKNVLHLDTISLTGSSVDGVDDIKLESALAFMHARGAFDYDKVGGSIIDYVNGFYDTGIPGTDTTLLPQQLEFEATVSDHPLLRVFVPGLLQFDGLTLSGDYRSANTDSALRIEAYLPYVQYENNVLRQGKIDIRSGNEQIRYAIQADTVESANMAFYGTKLSGAAAQDSISVYAVTQDEKAKDWFALNADFFQVDSQYNFRLKDTLRLNYELWSVKPDNFIRYGSDGLLIQNFFIQSDTASISAQSNSPVANSPINIAIDNFNIKSISSLMSGDTLFASGILDADVLLTDLNSNLPAYTGTASITDLAFMEQPVGNIDASAEKISAEKISAKISLTGNQNDVQVEGNYFLNNPQNQFDLNLQMNRFNAATLQGFSAGQIKSASGNMSGDIRLNGQFANPRWNGNIRFDTTAITPTQLDVPFLIHNQNIVFDYPNVRFNQFTIKDSLGHNLVVDGNIRSNSLTDYGLNIDIRADDFIVMNAERNIDNELFGFAQIDADLQITGTSESPDLEGMIKMNEKTNVTMVLPESNYEKDQGLSVVKFIDTDTFDVYQPPLEFTEAVRERVAFGRYLNYNFTIELERKATFRIIIDPSTGDELEVQGYALLNAGVDPGGNLVLSGNYDLDEGHYNFSYQFLNRKFDLKKGSTIQFGGAPMDANIDITATYTVNTDSQGLLGNEVTGGSSIANLLKQKLPYELQMKLSGVLSRPTITFSIDLPEGGVNINSDLQTAIDNKLAQLSSDETAMNRQAFSLLLFNRFVSEQSSDFFKGNGTNFSDLARQSVSQFLSSAIDNIAGDLIKGVDIDLALSSYEEYNAEGGSQQRTDLKLALSKKFLNDRLTITVGKNFGLEGQDAGSRTSSAGSPAYYPDFSAAYQLSKDGKYLIKGYRKNEYEAVLDGYVIESGVSFVVTLDYDKFIDLFKKKKKPVTINKTEKRNQSE